MSKYHYDRPDQVQRYSGIPHKQTPEEAGKWKQFKSWLLKKLGRGEDYYEAKVRTQEAQAANLDADSDLKRAQAEKARAEAALIRQQAAKIEQERLPQEVPEGMLALSPKELEVGLAKIMARIEQMRVVYGTEVEITEGQGHVREEIPEPSADPGIEPLEPEIEGQESPSNRVDDYDDFSAGFV